MTAIPDDAGANAGLPPPSGGGMMTLQQTRMFFAQDAFAYVDSYRRYSLDQPPTITDAKDRLEDQMAHMDMIPTRAWAELRGMEHALRFKLKRTEPGVVVLGESAGILDKEGRLLPPDAGRRSAEVKQLQEERDRLQTELLNYKAHIKQLEEYIHEQEVLLAKARQDSATLKRRLEQSYGYFVISGITALLAIVALIGILISK